MMGDDFTADKVPDLRVKIRGTAVAKVSIIRNNKYSNQQKPGTQDVAFTFRDSQPQAGTSCYYLRVEQANGHTAWSSPMGDGAMTPACSRARLGNRFRSAGCTPAT